VSLTAIGPISQCDVELDSGRTLTGSIIDNDGKPVSGVTIWGLTSFGYDPSN